MTVLDYSSIQSALQRVGVEMGAAECHGQLAALLCSLPVLTYQSWLEMALPELPAALSSGDALAAETDRELQQLFETTDSSIQGMELSFHLLLAGDDTALSMRLEQLAEWCSGFLLGLAMGGIKEYRGLPGDVPEFMQDMVVFSQTGDFTLEDEREDEKIYMELIEHIRMGVMLVYTELQHLHSGRNDGQVSIH